MVIVCANLTSNRVIFKRTADISLLKDFCNDCKTYLCWQVPRILLFIIISSFDLTLFKSLIFRSQNSTSPATIHVWHGLCLSWLESISLLQKVDLRSLLDLISPSIAKIFQSSLYLLNRTGRLTWIPSVKKFSLWSNCMEYKRNEVWTRTKSKDKAMRISCLKYFKIQIKSRVSTQNLMQPEF